MYKSKKDTNDEKFNKKFIKINKNQARDLLEQAYKMAKTISMWFDLKGSGDNNKRDRRTESRMKRLKRRHNMPSMVETLRGAVDFWYENGGK